MPTSHCMGFCAGGGSNEIVARHDAVANVLTTRLRSLPGVTVVEEPPAPTEALPGARADLKVDVKARKWLVDVAIVCPATKSLVATQEYLRRQVRNIQGGGVEAGGRLGPAAKKFIGGGV